MRTFHLKILLRVALVLAIVASTALLVDYQSTSGPSFCGVGSGCSQVRASAFSHIFGVPLPVFGLAGFGLLFVGASFARSRLHYRLLALACGLAALGAIGLIGLMVFVIEAVCQWCMGVDAGAIVAAIAAFMLMRREPDEEPSGSRWLWTGAAVAAAVVTLLWGRDPEYKPPPEDVAKLQVPGKVTLVVFTDFECPFCRVNHGVIEDIAAKYPEIIVVREVMVPLPMHLAAEPTARAYLCADPTRQKELSNELYALPYDEIVNDAAKRVAESRGVSLERLVEQLNAGDKAAVDGFTAGLEQTVNEKALSVAAKVGLDREAIKNCMTAPETRARLDEQIATFRRLKLEGLPATYVGNYLVQGADEAMLRSAVSATISGGGLSVRWMFIIIAAMVGAVIVLSLGAQRAKAAAATRGSEPPRAGDVDTSAPEEEARGAGARLGPRRRHSERPAADGSGPRKGRTSRRPPSTETGSERDEVAGAEAQDEPPAGEPRT